MLRCFDEQEPRTPSVANHPFGNSISKGKQTLKEKCFQNTENVRLMWYTETVGKMMGNRVEGIWQYLSSTAPSYWKASPLQLIKYLLSVNVNENINNAAHNLFVPRPSIQKRSRDNGSGSSDERDPSYRHPSHWSRHLVCSVGKCKSQSKFLRVCGTRVVIWMCVLKVSQIHLTIKYMYHSSTGVHSKKC